MSDPELILRFDPASPLPAYRQIVDGLRAYLVSGVMNAGQRLPAVRALARDLGVHHNTVAEAYRRLASEGWLELKRGRGAVVRSRTNPGADDETRRSFAERLDSLVAEALSAGVGSAWLLKRFDLARRDLETRLAKETS